MDCIEPAGVTRLLKAWQDGEKSALDQLTALVHEELRDIARRHTYRQANGDLLQPTALVNELYLQLGNLSGTDWQHRNQFYALCARIMRNVLVDAARARGAVRRGGNAPHLGTDEIVLESPAPHEFLLDLNRALEAFATVSPRQAEVVELRYFGGLSEEETAEVLQTSARTVRRDWQFARAWLRQELTRPRHAAAAG